MANIRFPTRNFQATIYTLWGAFGIRTVVSREFEGLLILVGERTIFRRRSKSEKPGGKKRKLRRFPSPARALQIISRGGEISERGTDLLRKALRATKLDRLRVKLILGLPDPADTGIMYGHYQWARAILSPHIDTRQIEIEPVFDRETIELQADLALKVRLPRLIFPSLRFFLSKPLRQAWR